MANTHNICFVSQITLGDGTIYYYCSSLRMAGVTLDTISYSPYILSVGDSQRFGNFGEGSAIGTTNMTLLLGQKQYQGSYNIDITKAFNNAACVIKVMDVDNDTTWARCDGYAQGIIKNFKIGGNSVEFSIDDANHKDKIILPTTTTEDIVNADSNLAITDIPNDDVDKRVPMQFGNLNDTASGIFGKALLISEKIGFQEIRLDTQSLNAATSIGMWENGMKRYFAGKSTGEYTIDTTTKKFIKFRVDSTTTLGEDLGATTGIETFLVADYTKITWVDESDYTTYDDIDNYPEILSVNIIAVGDELMMVVEQPSSNTIRCERGYGGTTVATHSNGATIYQAASFAAKNLLTFTETFYPKAVTNQYYYNPLSTYNMITDGSWTNLLDTDWETYIRFASQQAASLPITDWADDTIWQCINFDLCFDKAEDDFSVYGAYVIGRFYVSTRGIIEIYMINSNATYNSMAPANDAPTKHPIVIFGTNHLDENHVAQYYSTTGRTLTYGDLYNFSPNLLKIEDIEANYSGSTVRTIAGEAVSFQNLTNLNNKWKMNIRILKGAADGGNFISIYRIGFMVDMFANFTNRRLVCNISGRNATADSDAVFNTSAVGSLATTPQLCLALILLTDIGYTANDFDTTSWRAVNTYRASAGPYSFALSYGIDEKEKGWDLCQKLASEHGLALTKTSAGKIKLIDLFQLQDKNESNGYPSLTAYKISMDDIVISGGEQQINLQQTGTDSIKNVISIKYKRNNSTDEYQSIYPTVQSTVDSTILKESAISLSTARTNYYGGQKTEILEIEALSVYDEVAAIRLWTWNINDKAEGFFYAEILLPYYHYVDVNSKSSQYDIGDIIYLDGIYRGTTFNNSFKWVIRNIGTTDQGHKVKIEAKSIKPISEI